MIRVRIFRMLRSVTVRLETTRIHQRNLVMEPRFMALLRRYRSIDFGVPGGSAHCERRSDVVEIRHYRVKRTVRELRIRQARPLSTLFCVNSIVDVIVVKAVFLAV